MKRIVFATGNLHKLQELNQIAGNCGIEFVLPPKNFNPIENGKTFEENSYIKASEAARLSGMTALADDSGLCVEVLNGAPGIYSARYAETQQKKIDKLLNELKEQTNRKAKFVCAMTLVSPDGKIIFQTTGECYGIITEKQAGTNGFGYDPIFRPDGFDINIAEMSDEEKNAISHRGNALRKVLEFLKNSQ
ncbi:RdgB/HAM1 family non-canonical purine NTP pyrophosphatase [bacterium]|nr:RdgB/HAM1 family non-canonical purine NTP pyrophosphatase [bacterium]